MNCFAILGFVFLCSSVFSSESRFEKCAKIKNEQLRLKCFDLITPSGQDQAETRIEKTGNNTENDTPAFFGKWQFTEGTDPLNDARKIVATLRSDEGSNSLGDSISIHARCADGKTSFYVDWKTYLGTDYDDMKKYVTHRFDSDRASKRLWQISNDKTATFAHDARRAIQNIAKTQKFVLSTVPYASNPITATFDTRGSKVALKRVADACGWDIDGKK